MEANATKWIVSLTFQRCRSGSVFFSPVRWIPQAEACFVGFACTQRAGVVSRLGEKGWKRGGVVGQRGVSRIMESLF